MKKPTRKTMTIIAITLIGTWLLGDLGYTTVTKIRQKKWEAKVSRDKDGIRTGATPYTLGSGSTPLLFIHGFADSPATWQQMISATATNAEISTTCRAMRLPGFNEPIDNLRTATLKDWLTEVDSEVSALTTTHKETKPWLIGHSTGGALAIRYAQLHADKISGIILMAPLLEVSDDRSPLFSSRQWFNVSSHCLPFTDTIENVFPIDSQRPIPDELDTRDRFIPQNTYRQLYALTDAIQAHPTNLSLPILILSGQHDEIVDLKATKTFMQKQCDPKQTKMWLLPNSAHVIPIDYDWEQALNLSLTFITTSKETK